MNRLRFGHWGRAVLSLGAFHAANFALKHADLFPQALCFSGNYDPSSWLNLLLVCGRGQWEDTTGALDSTCHISS